MSGNAIINNDFPSRFGSTVLSTFDASLNPLEGEFNVSVFFGATNLQNLLMAGCSINATLPEDIDQLQNLITLDFENNLSISGPIPTALGAITSLENIFMGTNLLTGTIPTQLAQLVNLTNLELQFNTLTGAIPTEFENLPKLVNFNCEGNSVEGC